MASFRGVLQVEGDPDSSLVADVMVTDGRISLRSGNADIGDWDLNDIRIEETAGAFRILADDEALVLRVTDAKRFSGVVGLPPPTSPTQDLLTTTQTPADTPTPAPTEPETDRPEAVKEKRYPGPDETATARFVSWSLAGAAAVLFLGAALDWGHWRLTSSDLSIARVLTGLAGLAALASAYLGLAGEKRRDVAILSLLSGIIALLVIVLYSREAGIGYGFIVTILGTFSVVGLAALALSHFGAPPPESSEQENAIR